MSRCVGEIEMFEKILYAYSDKIKTKNKRWVQTLLKNKHVWLFVLPSFVPILAGLYLYYHLVDPYGQWSMLTICILSACTWAAVTARPLSEKVRLSMPNIYSPDDTSLLCGLLQEQKICTPDKLDLLIQISDKEILIDKEKKYAAKGFERLIFSVFLPLSISFVGLIFQHMQKISMTQLTASFVMILVLCVIGYSFWLMLTPAVKSLANSRQNHLKKFRDGLYDLKLQL